MEKIKLTEEQKKEYLKDPDQCPYCHSLDISAEQPDFDNTACFREVVCNEEDCGRKWMDVYELLLIEEL